MKKTRFFAVVLLVVMSLCMAAQAADMRAAGGKPILSFTGTTANCSVTCKGNNTSDQVSANLTLYQGKTQVDSWSGSGKGKVSLSGQHKVTSGKSYTLTLTYSINGVSQSSKSATGTCP